MTTAAVPSLRVHDLHYTYPDGHVALRGVNLTIARGERVALLGPNGAGKTTLVLHLNGILHGGGHALTDHSGHRHDHAEPSHSHGPGSVDVAGLTVDPGDRKGLAEIRRRVGVVFQDPDDQLFMPTVAEDVAFGPANLGLRGVQLAERVDEALAAVGMSEHRDRAPHHLSFGQRRRVAVATVLAMRPEILVLDEPSSNLDPASRRELAEILLSLPVTMLMVTHDLPYALQLCPRSVILDTGAVASDGETGELLGDAELLARHRLELPYGFHLSRQ
jgi:cobalt/nickel transport system ATP-binding protein